MARSENIGLGIISRIASGVPYAVSVKSPNAWFGPSAPFAPVAQAPAEQVIGRQFDYPVGFNIRIRPRGEESVSFADMRAVADA